MYFSPLARHQYRLRNEGHNPQIAVADLGFALHALVISSLQFGQVIWYTLVYPRWYPHSRKVDDGLVDDSEQGRGFQIEAQPANGRVGATEQSPLLPPTTTSAHTPAPSPIQPSPIFSLLILLLWLTALSGAIAVYFDKLQLLDWLYLVSGMKLVISVIKFVPQVYLNWKMKSSAGFATTMPILVSVTSLLPFLCRSHGDFSVLKGIGLKMY